MNHVCPWSPESNWSFQLAFHCLNHLLFLKAQNKSKKWCGSDVISRLLFLIRAIDRVYLLLIHLLPSSTVCSHAEPLLPCNNNQCHQSKPFWGVKVDCKLRHSLTVFGLILLLAGDKIWLFTLCLWWQRFVPDLNLWQVKLQVSFFSNPNPSVKAQTSFKKHMTNELKVGTQVKWSVMQSGKQIFPVSFTYC